MFADPHGIIIVVGGTITVALISFSFKKLSDAFKIVVRKTLGRERDNYIDTIKLIVKLADAYRVNPKGLEAQLPANAHPFLRDAVQMISNFGFTADEMSDVLTNSMKGKLKRDEEELKVWHTISRFPPAFGLLGATLGMISLLQTLGEPGAQSRIGQAMATALIATFYGLVVANLILLPISEKLGAVASSDKVMRSIIKDGVIMIVEKKHPTYIEEFLKQFLSPTQRAQAGSDSGGGSAGGKVAA
ncbi:MAG: MotA/TolQ/ExbB proton channel family protein [Bdellovibrionaceae bacterium]|nr:MotA/TolQ/ExbB proton channel family protein [Pseudobdellovibrionaceae bacterium]